LTSNAPQSGTLTICSGGTGIELPAASLIVSCDFSGKSRPCVASRA
jgi:hypothetical protein